MRLHSNVLCVLGVLLFALLWVGCESDLANDIDCEHAGDSAGPPAADVIAACGERREYTNSGSVCTTTALDVAPDLANAQTFAADQSIYIGFVFGSCLSGSCDVDRVASCEVTVDGNKLRVTTSAAITELDSASCLADCGAMTAYCKSEPLGAGTYEIVYGEQTANLEIPSKASPACVHGSGEISWQ